MVEKLYHLQSGGKDKKVKVHEVTVKVMEPKLKLMATSLGLKKASAKTILEAYLKHRV